MADTRMRRVHDQHADSLRRYLVRLTLGERHLAEDLLQETMVRAWRHIDALPVGVESERRWLFTVARRIAVDAARARRARPVEVGSYDLAGLPEPWDGIDDVVTVRAALPRLSETHRRVLVEIFYRGLSTGEVARRTGVPEGTVKSRTHYALRALREAIGACPTGR